MKQRATRMTVMIFVAAALFLSSVSVVSADTVQTRIGSSAKVWGYVANGPAATRTVAMWQKKRTDIDILIFGDQPPPNGILVGVGLGREDRLETVEIGAPSSSALTFVVLVKSSGPATKVWFNVCTMGRETLTPLSAGAVSQSGLAFIGTLDELAAQDPFFENMRQTLENVTKAKKGSR